MLGRPASQSVTLRRGNGNQLFSWFGLIMIISLRKKITHDVFRYIMGEITGGDMADEDEYRYMTYDEAAALLRIKPDSVRRRAASKKWPKKRGNDRKARVGIPIHIIPEGTPAPIPAPTPDDMALREELATTKTALARLEGQAEATAARLVDLARDRDAWRSQAEALSRTIGERRAGFWSRIFRS